MHNFIYSATIKHFYLPKKLLYLKKKGYIKNHKKLVIFFNLFLKFFKQFYVYESNH